MPYYDFETVQVIATKGAWSLDVFETRDGVMLVVGNIYDSDLQKTDVDAEIYRFSENAGKVVDCWV